jgi:hypothetical protein
MIAAPLVENSTLGEGVRRLNGAMSSSFVTGFVIEGLNTANRCLHFRVQAAKASRLPF